VGGEMKKKTNPRRKPATQADVKKAKHKAVEEAVRLVVYMVLYVLIDKHNAPREDIQQLAREVNDVADSIAKGYLDWKDIRQVLEEEYEVIWEG